MILSNPAAASILADGRRAFDELVAASSRARRTTCRSSRRLGGPVEVRAGRVGPLARHQHLPGQPRVRRAFDEAETTIIVLRDITAARRARAAREAFIGVMSHELRTPITTIYGTTKLFGRAADSPELMRSMLSDVEAEADRLYRLVEDLLILSAGRSRASRSKASRSSCSTSCGRCWRPRRRAGRQTRFISPRAGRPAAGLGRPDVPRAGRPQPPQQRRQVRPTGHGSSRCARRSSTAERRGARAGQRSRVRAATRRSTCSSCSTARRPRRRRRPAPASGSTSAARSIEAMGGRDLGASAARKAAPNSASRCRCSRPNPTTSMARQREYDGLDEASISPEYGLPAGSTGLRPVATVRPRIAAVYT